MNEAVLLLVEGARIEDIDGALTDFGFPVGPMTLLDEVGIDVGAKVGKILHAAFGDRMAAARGAGRGGRVGPARAARTGRASTRYGDRRSKRLDESVYDAPARRPGAPLDPGRGDRSERVVLQMVNEAILLPGRGDPAQRAGRRRGRGLRPRVPALPRRALPLRRRARARTALLERMQTARRGARGALRAGAAARRAGRRRETLSPEREWSSLLVAGGCERPGCRALYREVACVGQGLRSIGACDHRRVRTDPADSRLRG